MSERYTLSSVRKPGFRSLSSNLDHPSNRDILLDEEEPWQDIQAEEEEEEEAEDDDHQDRQQKTTQQGKSITTHHTKSPNSFSSSATLEFKHKNEKYGSFVGKMKEGLSQASPRLLKRTKGQMVDVHGGRIVRSTGRKDRHSKVCTAKGPRDRRVRLSANTAIEFYDVQDRLGYDRPSKAIDWLMKEARAAIDALDELPAFRNPDDITSTQFSHLSEQNMEKSEFSHSECGIQDQLNVSGNPNFRFSFFSRDVGAAPSSSTDFHSQISVTKSQTQELCLSLQPFQDEQNFLQHHSSPIDHFLQPDFSSTSHFQRAVTWNSNSSSSSRGGRKELVNDSLMTQHFQPGLGLNHLFWPREPLQSSYFPSIHATMNTSVSNTSYPGIGLTSDALSGFPVLPIQGQEKQSPVSNKKLSSTSFLHYQD